MSATDSTSHPDAPRHERTRPGSLHLADIDAVLRPALEEDIGGGDLTTESSVAEGARARARLVSKAAGRVAGLSAFARTFELIDPGVRAEFLARDGDSIVPGQELCLLEGPARALLVGERTALNLLQRLSGIATLTARFVEAAGGAARILDTRKTTPNLRVLEKYAVTCGGGENHRAGLYDEVMIKNNHVDLAGRDLAALLRRAREQNPRVRITSEARDAAEAEAGVLGGADVVMLDNMSPGEMARLGPRLRELARGAGREIEIEASGGVTLENVAEVASSGVDRISVGATTHSAPALDLSLYLERIP